jgi:phosphate transport system protein
MSTPSDHQHIVSAFDRELTELRRLVVEMGEAVVTQTRDAMAALIAGDALRARQVIAREPDIDALSVAADEEVFRVIAKRQPTAVDLRLVLAVSRVVGELERGGDKAARIAHNALRLLDDGEPEPLSETLARSLRTLENLVAERLEQAVNGLVDAELAQAVTVFESEPTLQQARQALTDALVAPDADFDGNRLAALLTIAHALERIGNHAGNIAEQVVYVITAEDVRYRNRNLLIDALKHNPERD